MALSIAKQNTTCPENDFIIKFQPFIIIFDTLDNQNMFFYFQKLDLFVHPFFCHLENSNLNLTTLVDLKKEAS